MQEIQLKQKKTRIHFEGDGTGCPERLWLLHLWRCVPEHALSSGSGPDNLQRPLPTGSARSVYPSVEVGAKTFADEL